MKRYMIVGREKINGINSDYGLWVLGGLAYGVVEAKSRMEAIKFFSEKNPGYDEYTRESLRYSPFQNR